MSLIKSLGLPLKTRINKLAEQEANLRRNLTGFTIERRYEGPERRQYQLSYSGPEKRQYTV